MIIFTDFYLSPIRFLSLYVPNRLIVEGTKLRERLIGKLINK